MKIKIGTRDSKLALIQTEMVIEKIKAFDASIEIEIVAMKTTGDKILNVTLDKIGGKGLFVKELDDALTSKEVDITVHSYKDMPTEINENLPIVALSKREDPRDVLIAKTGKENSEYNILGSSSARRRVQLKKLGYNEINPIRGNLSTRLNKLDNENYDGIVLAAAGVIRSGLENRVDRYFSTEEIIPAACQGIIAVQGRKGENHDYLNLFNCSETEFVAKAERAFITKLNGGCSAPIAAYATLNGDEISLKGMFVDENDNMFIDIISGKKEDAKKLGIELAEKILRKKVK